MSMMYFSLSTALYVSIGYRHFPYDLVLSLQISWLRLPHRFSPHIHSLLRLIVMKGKALVKAQDHKIYKKVVLSRAFINSYDLGKMQNIKLIFNTREEG
ncbi:hypothetical protein K435DRAFT_779730 [Dendrothele bispora CBS 962.96]|uniref:Uncharacterized protein n=1 Tax=Dendrothele bispora (strain CBS 962.96) TaxID=1314807 RepID=A0A4S8LX43_DENBC|nr:hypothetical protein K435DRAFT_779730 [Dendrothele bispora CBS 962.96]